MSLNVAFAASMVFAFLLCLVLAGHFLRMGSLSGVALCLAMPLIAVLTRARWALRAVQILLGLGSITWVATAARIGAQRRSQGEPWLRMALILGTVSILSAAAAWLLSGRSVLERYRK